METARFVTKVLVENGRLVSLNVTSSEKSFVCGLGRLLSEPVLQTRKTPLERLMPELGTSNGPIFIPDGWTKIGTNFDGGVFVKKLRTNGVSPSVLVLQASGSAA